MTFQEELDRLDNIINADGFTDEQREAATIVWNRLLDQQIRSAWYRIEARSGEYAALVARLTAVVDGLVANPASVSIDTVNGILTDVQAAADAAGDA